MKFQNSLISLAVGFAMGISLVLSCGDESPPRVDAADAPSCDCPASEPPVVAGRIQRVEQALTLPANSTRNESVVCPLAGIALSGGCQGGVNENVVLVESSGGDRGWSCTWRNLTNTPVEMRVSAQCLMPPQQ
jgi:hypothetical protein